jgi:hypothetical protein
MSEIDQIKKQNIQLEKYMSRIQIKNAEMPYYTTKISSLVYWKNIFFYLYYFLVVIVIALFYYGPKSATYSPTTKRILIFMFIIYPFVIGFIEQVLMLGIRFIYHMLNGSILRLGDLDRINYSSGFMAVDNYLEHYFNSRNAYRGSTDANAATDAELFPS